MRLIDLTVVYLIVGMACAVAVARRPHEGARARTTDALLSLALWPLYVPVLLAPPPPPRPAPGTADPAIAREHALLLAAVGAVREPTIAGLLPTRAQLDLLATELHTLDGKVRELDEVLAQSDFDPQRAERHLREAVRAGTTSADNARLMHESIRRLTGLRARAARDRDELLSLCQRLRMQVTVLRFAGTSAEDVGCVVAEILGRIEGAGAAFGDPPGSEGSPDERAA